MFRPSPSQTMNYFANSGRDYGSVTTEFEDYQRSAIMKATAISRNVSSVTIGPNSIWANSEPDDDLTNNLHVSPLRRSQVAKEDKSKANSSLKYMNCESRGKPLVSKPEAVDSSSRSRRKLLYELDQQRQCELKEKIQIRVYNMENQSKVQREVIITKQENLQRENQARVLREEQHIILQIKEEELRSIRRQEQLVHEHQQHAKRVYELNQRIKEAEQKQKEAEERQKEVEEEEQKRIRDKKIQLDKIHQFQVEYRAKYQIIHDIVKSCKDKQALIPKVSNHAIKLKNLNEAMDQLVKQCKVGEVSNLDLQTASAIVSQLDPISSFIQDEVGRVNEEFGKAAAEASPVRQETKSPPEVGPNVIQTPPNDALSHPQKSEIKLSDLSEIVDKEALRTFTSLQQFSVDFQNSYADLAKDERMKKFRFDCQKAVNIPVNAISPVNAAHLQDKFQKLSCLLSGKSVEVGQGVLVASSHPQGIAFCKDLLATKFVGQGELTVSSKPEAAFAIAAVIVALWLEYPDFGQLLLSHFHRECPYLVPIFLPQLEGQSNQEYYRSLGYNYSENGEVEKQDKFLKRMSGIMRLYAAIIISRPPRMLQNKLHPHGIQQAWRWLACMLNMDPRPDICASLLYDFLEVTGNTLSTYYGLQFQKLLHVVCKEYFPKIQKITASESGGPVTRLELFLQKILKQGRIPPPVGCLPVNFW